MDATSSTTSPVEHGPPLPEDVASCHQVIRELWAENQRLRSRVVELESKVEQFERKLEALLRRSFAARSERSKQALMSDS